MEERGKRVKKRDEEALGAKLPPDIWEEIGKRLDSRLDILRFRSVCSLWRSSLPPPRRFPLRVPPPPVGRELSLPKMPFFITEDTVYVVDSGPETESVLAVFEQADRSGKFLPHAVLPWEKERLMNYNSSEVLCTPDDPLSRLLFVSKFYRLCTSSEMLNFTSAYNVAKVVLISSSNTNSNVNPYYVSESDLAFVALSNGGELALLRLGGHRDHLSMNWETNFSHDIYDDIISYKGKLCAVDHQGRAFLLDYNSLQMTQVAPPVFYLNKFGACNLVEAFGDLYLIVEGTKTQPLKVYKLGLEVHKWVEVESLGNLAFFVSFRFCFSVARDILTRNMLTDNGMMRFKGSLIFVKGLKFSLYGMEDQDKDEADCKDEADPSDKGDKVDLE